MADQQYQLENLSTLDVAKPDRLEYWTAHVRINHGHIGFDFADTHDFVGSTQVQRCGDYQLVEFSSDLVGYRRTARHIRDDDDRSARLIIPLDGRIALTQLDDTVELGSGDVGLVSMGRSMGLAHEDGARAWILSIPEGDPLASALTDSPLLMPDSRRPMLGTVVAMVRAVADHRESMTARDFVRINSNLLDLLGMALDDRQAPDLSGLEALARAARTYVDNHSDDPSVTPDSIAAHMNCSLRQLHKALGVVQTTPALLLRHTRLARARRRLEDPFNRDSIDRIAFGSGFNSLSTFRESFRNRYGIYPAALRKNRIR
ncbi:helix-turn-helix domain-containing protein [Nocardia sp. NPDC050710]|uniref:helix-turn-helix domain-containing protein n=1 Tax=Nocardia sp. NPDC050710 TaxID=3157220 RepID=UPI0034000B70